MREKEYILDGREYVHRIKRNKMKNGGGEIVVVKLYKEKTSVSRRVLNEPMRS